MDLIKPIVLFGNGDLPVHSYTRKKLQEAATLICVDGGADKVISSGFKPDIILGDLDSIMKDEKRYQCPVIPLKDQSKNDLEKSLEWCIKQNISEIDLIGFFGGRDDQYLVTMEITKKFINEIRMTLYTNFSIIYCVNQYTEIQSEPGQIISIISFYPETKITTEGLKYSLNSSALLSPSNGISNIALKSSFKIHTNNWIFIFKNHIP